jgi:hypothetical protein
VLTAGSASADVKVKTKQTMAGQSYENTTYIKGKRQRSEQMGGMSVSLTQCDLRRSVQLNPNAKTYMVTPFPDSTTTTTSRPASTGRPGEVTKGGVITSTITIKDTGERKQMFGYTARHLIITIETASSPDACNKTNSKMQQDGWYIDAEFALDCDYGYAGGGYYANRAGGCQDRYQVKNVGTGKRGYPVYEKMTMFDESGKETYSMVNEVVELSKATLDQALFDVPGDYREVTDSSQLYTASASTYSGSQTSTISTTSSSTSGQSSTMSQYSGRSQSTPGTSQSVGPKKEGVVRIGLSGVKTGAIGEGITAADLAAAVQNTLIQYLKAPNIEVVPLEAKLASVIESEAREKECDYVLFATVSHKKGGGGGFGGMFGKALGTAIGQTGIGHTGSVAGNIAGQVATQAIVSATTVSAQDKSKDELTLEVKANKADGTAALANSYKAKAKSNGDDIVSQVVEQAALAIVSGLGK